MGFWNLGRDCVPGAAEGSFLPCAYFQVPPFLVTRVGRASKVSSDRTNKHENETEIVAPSQPREVDGRERTLGKDSNRGGGGGDGGGGDGARKGGSSQTRDRPGAPQRPQWTDLIAFFN